MARVAVAFAAAICLLWATRSRWLPHAIADAPNAGKTSELLVRHAHALSPRELRVDVGPPAAELSIAVLEPSSRPVRGTILVLHGIRDDKRSMSPLGRTFSDAGYRAILVDLRGHGESTGDYLSFGTQDGRDLVRVVDRLAAEGLLALPLGVYGPSYGGAAALQLARHEPRVRAVVTVATFTRMRDIVPLYAERIAPTWFVSRRDLADAIDRAGASGGFDPNDSDSVAAIAQTSAQVLLLHGRADANIPWQHSDSLHAAAPTHSRLVILDGRDHGSIMSDETVFKESLAWFDRWLGDDAAPSGFAGP